MSMGAPEFVTFSNLIIDDIVLADGRSFMNTLGGSGTHTLIGMRPWSDRLGYVGYRGTDLDPQHLAYLARLGVDVRGVVLRTDVPTARAWQLFEPDDRRIEIFRNDIALFNAARPRLDEVPDDYFLARGYHMAWGPLEDAVELLDRIAQVNPGAQVVSEVSLGDMHRPFADHLMVLRRLAMFSPDRIESKQLLGTDAIPAIFERFLGAGIAMIALRLGALGSLVGTAAGEYYRVPAVPPAQLVDVTGAGNAYCGGFAVGLGRGEAPADAAARAAASASFALEQIGVPVFDEARLADAQRRLDWALARISVARDVARLMPAELT